MKTPRLYERLFELALHPGELFSFCKSFLTSFEKSATIFNDALSYLKEEQFAELMVAALETLKQKKNENAAAVIHYASLQFPQLLHQHLHLVFKLNPNQNAYYTYYPWRHLPPDKIKPFTEQLQGTAISRAQKQKLFSCLLQTRNADAVKFAWQFALDTSLFQRDDQEEYLLYYLQEVGFTVRNGELVTYCPNPLKHFCSPANYFSGGRPIQINREQHPTWRLVAEEEQYAFGGLIAADENNLLSHIITFNTILPGFKISGLDKLTLGVHVRELNEHGEIFYRHHVSGSIQKIAETRVIEEYRDLPVKETQVSFAATPDRCNLQSWGSANSRENLFRLGGEPTWIQSAEVLSCPSCKEQMDFLMQLDSDLPDINNNDLYFGSGGLSYIFWCDACKVSGYLMQCT